MQNSFVRRAAAALTLVAGLTSAVLMPIAAHAGSQVLSNLQQDAAATGNAALGTSGTPQSLPVLVGKFIGAALGLLGVVLVVLIIYAGFLWMTAQGDPDKVKKAKGIITNA